MDELVAWIASNSDRFLWTTSLQTGELLIFASVGMACASLGLILYMNRSIAECNWRIQGITPDNHFAPVYSIQPRFFVGFGIALLSATLIILLATLEPTCAGRNQGVAVTNEMIQRMRIILKTVGFLIMSLAIAFGLLQTIALGGLSKVIKCYDAWQKRKIPKNF